MADARFKPGAVAAAPRMYTRWFLPLAVLIFLLAFGLRVRNLGAASLWADEAWTATWAASDFGDMLRTTVLRRASIELPLYLSSLRLFPTTNEVLLRFPSVAVSLIGISAFMLLLKQIKRDPFLILWGGAVLATNPLHVWLSRTARPYAYFFALTVFVVFFFLLLLKGRRSRAIWAGFIMCSLLVYLTHYFALFLPVVQYLLLGLQFRRYRTLLRPWLVAQILASLGLLFTWLVQLWLNNPIAAGIAWIPDPKPVDLFLSLGNMLVGYTGTPTWYLLAGLLSGAIGFSVGVARSLALRDAGDLFGVLLTAIPLISTFILSKLLHPIYVDRYLFEAQVGVLMVMLSGWWWLPQVRWRHALALIVVMSGLLDVWHTFSTGNYQREDWRAATDYIANHFLPGDLIVLDIAFNDFAFRYYFEEDDIPRITVQAADTAAEAGFTRLWAIYRNPIEDAHRQGAMPEFDPFDPTHSPMGKWLAAHQDRVLRRADFTGISVMLLAHEQTPPDDPG